MPQTIPKYVDLRRAPLGRLEYEDALGAERLPRLAESGVAVIGTVDVQLALTVRERQPALASGELRGALSVECQRCLQPMQQDIDVAIDWETVSADRDEPLGDGDPIVVEDHRFELIEAIEEELLLSIPDYPRHDTNNSDCKPPAVDADTDADSS